MTERIGRELGAPIAAMVFVEFVIGYELLTHPEWIAPFFQLLCMTGTASLIVLAKLLSGRRTYGSQQGLNQGVDDGAN